MPPSPEYQIQSYFGGSHWGTYPNPHGYDDPGSGYYFRIGTHQDMKGKATPLPLVFDYDKEIKSIGATVYAKSASGIDVEMDTHIMSRSSQFNPYAETWIVGDISVIANIDVTVTAHLCLPLML